ncbi:hypothetical protein KCU77_g1169, partial [Aureobasidium melanogenum]
MRCFNLLKCCKSDTAGDLDCLPPARAIELKKLSAKRVNSFLPTSTRPISELDVSPSSSTSLAMFDYEAMISIPPRTNSFTTQGNFEDVDLSSPTIFSSPPSQARKVLSSPFGDRYKVAYTLAIDGTSSSDDYESSYTSTRCSTEPSVLFEEPSRVSSFDTCPSPFDDEHEVEQDIEYAPTAPSPNNEYTQRAMEYRRVCLLFGPGSVEYNNLQRDHALAVLEGIKPQRNDPLRQSFPCQDSGRDDGQEPSVLNILRLITPFQVFQKSQGLRHRPKNVAVIQCKSIPT